jgi:hypothetical protein
MLERIRQAADELEAAALPQPDRAFVAADDEVELHRPEPAGPRSRERVRAHRARDAASAG